MKKKATAKQPAPFEDRYPNIPEWLSGVDAGFQEDQL
jgi:hypothetical protein